MGLENLAVIGVGAVSGLVVLVWFVTTSNHPENGCSHVTRSVASGSVPTRSERLYELADRPAGPDAEPMDPVALGGDQTPPPVVPAQP